MTIRESRNGTYLQLDCLQGGVVQASLTIQQLEPKLWRVQKLHSRPGFTPQLVEALRAIGQAEQPQFRSNNLKPEVNALLGQAGWRVKRRKAFVERSLLESLPEVTAGLQLKSLAQTDRATFVRVMLDASQGDPFDSSTPESAEQDFLALVEYAGSTFDPQHWFVALQDGQEVGVLLPQIYADEPETGTVFYLGICPAFRERGLGQVLHAEGLRQLQARGARKYQDSSDMRNVGMRRIFALNGCTEIRQQWFYEWAGT